jgi:hypothetical protein
MWNPMFVSLTAECINRYRSWNINNIPFSKKKSAATCWRWVGTGHALKTNITTRGPLVLPFSEQLLFFAGVLFRHLFPSKASTPAPTTAPGDASAAAPYIPDFKRAFENFCMHAASGDVLEHLQSNLSLRNADLKALHKFSLEKEKKI